jgi:hypothetical protein
MQLLLYIKKLNYSNRLMGTNCIIQLNRLSYASVQTHFNIFTDTIIKNISIESKIMKSMCTLMVKTCITCDTSLYGLETRFIQKQFFFMEYLVLSGKILLLVFGLS